MVLPDKAGKEFVNKITRLLNAWVEHSCLKDAALKAIMAPPSLLIQNPGFMSYWYP